MIKKFSISFFLLFVVLTNDLSAQKFNLAQDSILLPNVTNSQLYLNLPFFIPQFYCKSAKQP